MSKFNENVKDLFENWNTIPNWLCFVRIALIPVFSVLFIKEQYIAAFITMIVAALTDVFDGKIARKYNLITDFGKFMDPIADKLLVCSALIALVELERIPSWVVIIIIGREFIISGFRLVASDKGIVIAAGNWGKAKTVCQVLLICLVLLNLPSLQIWTDAAMVVTLILTVVSLIDYLIKNKDVLKG